MNNFNEFIMELGYESLSSEKMRSNKFDEDSISNYFQGLKGVMKSLKGKFSDYENKMSKKILRKN